MKNKNKTNFFISAGLLATFVLWTVAVMYIDVRAIGPRGSQVGFALLNGTVHSLTGVNFTLYNITDWLGLVPIFVCLGFGALGLCQLIKRKSVVKVDFDIIALGVFYAVVIAVFIFFEVFVVNYRPVLIEGVLEASYPSSTTLLVMCVIPSAAIQFKKRIKNNALKKLVITLCVAFTVFMVVGRLISGVHWITDIIGGALFSAGIVEMYLSFINLNKR